MIFPIEISKIHNNAKATTLAVASMGDLASSIVSIDWSPAIFKNGRRKNKNFLRTSLMVLDVDQGCALASAQQLFQSYRHIIATSRNHDKSKNGVVCDRFRVILFLDRPIVDRAVYSATWEYIYSQFPFIDKNCKDPSRFYYKCVKVESINLGGAEITPVKPIPSLSNGNSSASNTISSSTSSMYRSNNSFGKQYKHLIYKELLATKLQFRSIRPLVLAGFLAENITRLRKRKAGINQDYLAKRLKVSKQAVSQLLKRLVKAEILAIADKFYVRGFESIKYGLGNSLKGKLAVKTISLGSPPTDKWANGTANTQMLNHVRWCYDNGYSQQKTLRFCLKMQGTRPADKMRSKEEIMAAIENWWNKAA